MRTACGTWGFWPALLARRPGAARHTEGEYAAAVSAYKAALSFGVPHRDECTVRINVSLADESIGDRAAKANHLDDADDAYRDGIAALEDGDCPTHSGRGADQTKDLNYTGSPLVLDHLPRNASGTAQAFAVKSLAIGDYGLVPGSAPSGSLPPGGDITVTAAMQFNGAK